jgi:hypothetical protein
VKEARHGVLAPYLDPAHIGIGSINYPMQCMMKQVCAQCLQRHVDPKTGKESFVFSCFNQDQHLDEVDFPNLRARLRQNTVLEKLTNLWLTRELSRVGSAPTLNSGATVVPCALLRLAYGGRMRRASLLLLFVASPVWASIVGTVWSPSGTARDCARHRAAATNERGSARGVALADTAGPLASTTTDAQGAFRVEQNIDGLVVISVSATAMRPRGRSRPATIRKSRSSSIARRSAGRVTANGKASPAHT